jgi:hypothetical protein
MQIRSRSREQTAGNRPLKPTAINHREGRQAAKKLHMHYIVDDGDRMP